MGIELNMIDVVSNDLAASIAFYRRLGVDVPADKVWPSEDDPHHIEIEMSTGFRLALDSTKLAKDYDPQSTGPRTVFIFSVPTRDAVDELYAELTGAGHDGYEAPFDAFWGARYAIVLDPDGNRVGIVSPSDGEHTNPPGF